MSRRRYLSLGQKIGLVSASFSLPIVVLTYFVVSSLNAQIRFSNLELAGIAYQRPLERLLNAVQRYQLLSDFATNAEASRQRDELAAEVNAGFAALAPIDRQLAVHLQFTDEGLSKRNRAHLTAKLLNEQWQSIVAMPPEANDLQRSESLDKLVASLRETITHAGDTSNLILDPDLDSYYLMDVTLLTLPQMQDRMARTIADGRRLLHSDRLNVSDRVQMAVCAALLEEADLNRIMGALQTSLVEDANFYGVSPTLAQGVGRTKDDFQSKSAEFIGLTRKMAVDDSVDINPKAYVDAGLMARDASFTLWDNVVGELQTLLEIRLRDHVTRRNLALVGSGAALAVACILAAALTSNITKPLEQMADALEPGADLLNTSVRRMSASPERAELICAELVAHVSYMRQAVQQLALLVHGGFVTYASPSKTPSSKRFTVRANR